MELLREKLKNRQFQKPVLKVKKQYDNWWTEMGKEMSKYFGANCFWIAHTFERHKIISLFETAKKDNWKLKYFIGALRKK